LKGRKEGSEFKLREREIEKKEREREAEFCLPSKDPLNFVSLTLCGALLNRN